MEKELDLNSDISNKVLESISKKLRSIGHVSRLKILLSIVDDTACVGSLWECMGEDQSIVSQHLAILKKNDVVNSEAEGTKRYYKIVDPNIKEVILMIRDILKETNVRES